MHSFDSKDECPCTGLFYLQLVISVLGAYRPCVANKLASGVAKISINPDSLSFARPSVCPPVHSFIHSSIHQPSVRSFVCSFVHMTLKLMYTIVVTSIWSGLSIHLFQPDYLLIVFP
jgi:hypothetical protein